MPAVASLQESAKVVSSLGRIARSLSRSHAGAHADAGVLADETQQLLQRLDAQLASLPLRDTLLRPQPCLCAAPLTDAAQHLAGELQVCSAFLRAHVSL